MPRATGRIASSLPRAWSPFFAPAVRHESGYAARAGGQVCLHSAHYYGRALNWSIVLFSYRVLGDPAVMGLCTGVDADGGPPGARRGRLPAPSPRPQAYGVTLMEPSIQR